jgi:hypothetical protein
MLGTDKFKFDRMLSAFYQVLNLEDLPKDKMSIKTASMLGIYNREKRRFDRIKELEREAEIKNNV